MVAQPNIKLKKADLLRCPICNRKPKVKYSVQPTGVFVTVQCKPLFHKAHLCASDGQAGEICDRAEQTAFALWNMKVKYYTRMRRDT